MRKISSSGGRRMGGSGMRGISKGPSRGFRPSGGGFRSSTSSGFKYKPYRTGLNKHHSHLYRRPYGNSILPAWVRLLFVLFLLGIMALFGY